MPTRNAIVSTLARRKRAVAIGATAMIGAGALGLPIAFADDAVPRCPSYLLIEIPGTSETNPEHNPTQSVGMLSHISSRLSASRSASEFQAWSTPYPATVIDPQNIVTYGTSRDRAVTNATNEMRARATECPNTQFGLTGYSQGAEAAGDLAAQIGHGNGPIPAGRYFGGALLSDPKQTPGQGQLLAGDPQGEGFAGTRPDGFGSVSDRTASVCNDGDKYCSLGKDNFTLQLVGRLGSRLDPQDPVKSVAGVLGEFMSVDFGPLMRVTDQIKNAMAGPQGPQGAIALLPQAPQLAQQVAKALEDLGVEFGKKEMFAGLGPLSTTTGQIIDAAATGNLIVLPGLITQWVPQLITFSSNLANSISVIISKLPMQDYAAIGATGAAIDAAVSAQQYWLLPGLVGRIVGQIDSATRKTMRAVPQKDFPLIHRIANELTAEQAFKDLITYVGFIAGGTHVSYDSVAVSADVAQTPSAAGETGTELLADFLSNRMNGSSAQRNN